MIGREHERLLILADDFTGACDAAGAFGSARRTRVVFGTFVDWDDDDEVLAVDLDLRECAPKQAESLMRDAARRLTSTTDETIFVKIDSTLRGPIQALVAGALEGTGRSTAVVAPAFPEQGRLLRGGQVYVNGKPGASLSSSPGMVIVDAETTADLRALATAAREHPEWLLVGSAGLARQLAGATVPARIRTAEGPLLVVAGSPAAATREQLTHLSGREDIIVMSTPHTEARDSGEAAKALAQEVAQYAATREPPRAIVLTGGATARAVCACLGISALQIRGELQPGIPVGALRGGRWHGLTVVTKAGGFGRPETLVEVARALT